LPPPIDPERDHLKLTITRATWADRPDMEDIVELHVAEWFDDQNGDQYKRFTQACDREFLLRAEGAKDVEASICVGSITGPDLHCCVLQVNREQMKDGVPYRLVPRNGDARLTWTVAEGVTLTR
jgi:hypothetical protein